MQTIVHMQVTREVLAHHRVCSDEEYEMAVSVSPPLPDQFDLDRYMLYVYCVSNIQSVSNMLYMRFHSMFSHAVSSLSPLVKYVFKEASQCAYSFAGYNFISGHQHIKMYSFEDMLCAEVIRHYRIAFGRFSPFDDIIYIISCA